MTAVKPKPSVIELAGLPAVTERFVVDVMSALEQLTEVDLPPTVVEALYDLADRAKATVSYASRCSALVRADVESWGPRYENNFKKTATGAGEHPDEVIARNQRAENLRRANVRRIAAANFKKTVAEAVGDIVGDNRNARWDRQVPIIADLLRQTPETLDGMRIHTVVGLLWHVDERHVQRLLQQYGVRYNRRLREMSERQRRAIATAVTREWGPGGEARVALR